MLSMSGTFSKDPQAWGFDKDTRAIRVWEKGIVLNDGKPYLDWVSGLGAVLLGYQDRNFEEHLVKHIRKHRGFGTSITHQLEDKVAEKLVNMLEDTVPGMRKGGNSVRFAKSGTDATTMAVRLARAYTGKEIVVSFGYHGWSSEFIAADPPAHGIPLGYKRDLIRKIEFNNFNSLERAFDRGNIACLIFEHPPFEPVDGWYDQLRLICDHYNSLLIADEIVTGLRYGLGGACEKYNIRPDIICMGKGMANGLPISAVIARSGIMDWFSRVDPVFCSSTHWGEALSLAAADYVLDFWDEGKVDEIWNIGALLLDNLQYPEIGLTTFGNPPRSLLSFMDDYQKAFFIHGLRHHGILMNRPNFPTLAHDFKDASDTIMVMDDLVKQYKQIGEAEQKKYLENHLPRTLFKKR